MQGRWEMARTRDEKLDLLIRLLKKHKQDHVRDMLRAAGLARSGSWETLENRIRAAVREDRLTLDNLTSTLDAAEESGRQHVFLYRVPAALRTSVASEAAVRSRARSAGLENRINASSSIIDIPRSPTCTAIRITSAGVRIKWIEKREWTEPLGTNRVGDELTQRFRLVEGRAVNVLDYDWQAGFIDLRLSNVGRQSRADYIKLRDDYSELCGWLLNLQELESVELFRCMRRLIDAREEVRARAVRLHTPRGSTASFTSDSAERDLTDDPVFPAALGGLTGNADYRIMNAYFLPLPRGLSREIHVVLYADLAGNEVRFPAECEEGEEKYILARIRELAKP